MSEIKINYYEVITDTPVLDYDRTHKVAIPMKSKDNKKWMIEKGKYVKSFGNTVSVKTPEGKQDILILVNGNAVRVNDVKLYIDDVDDCGCDGNPIALPTDIAKAMMKEQQYKDVEFIKQESSFIPEKSKFDMSAVIGFLLGAVIIGGAVWFKTKSKKKAIIAAISGGFVGMVIGYFIGKRGEKKITDVSDISDTESTVSNTDIQPSPSGSSPAADEQQYLQVGERYSFVLKNPAYAMNYKDGVFYVAKNSAGHKMLLKNKPLSGTLVQIDKPRFFIFEADSKKIVQVQVNKPLPFIDLGNNVMIPLALVEQEAAISKDEIKSYFDGTATLAEDIYVKGRYAGKRYYNMMYMPETAELSKSKIS